MLHDLGLESRSHWHLAGSHAYEAAPVQHSLGGALDEHLGASAQFGLLDWHAAGAHRLAVTRELESEVLAPHGLDVLVADGSQILLLHSGLVDVHYVHLLAEDGQGGLGGLAYLLVNTLGLNT